MKNTLILYPVLICSLLFFSFTGTLAENSNDSELTVDSWLKSGPFIAQKPLFHDVENIRGERFQLANLLHFPHIQWDDKYPVAGESIQFNGTSSRWTEAGSDVRFSNSGKENEYHVYYLAAYVRAERWIETSIKIETTKAVSLYLNGNRVASKANLNDDADSPGTLNHNMNLERGHHRVVLKVVTGSESAEAPFSAVFTEKEAFQGALSTSLLPVGPLSLRHLTDSPQPTSVSLSPDGTITAVTMRQARPDENTWESWIELLKTDSGDRVATYRGGMQFWGMNWAPVGRVFSYTTRSSDKGTIWVVDLDRGTHEPVLRDVENLGGHTWSPDAKSIFYTISESYQPDGTGVSRLDGMHDRYPTWRTRSFIHRLHLESGTQQRLTAGLLTTSLNSISPDGNSMVFSRTHVDYSTRPFTYVEMVKMDLNTFETDILFEAPWVGGAQFSPDGKSLLLTGSPNAFGDVGRTTEGLANDYDSQAYIFDLESRIPRSITRDLDPDVNSARWSRDGRFVYVTGTDKTFGRVYRIEVRNNRITELDTGVDMAGGFSIAHAADRAAYIGHGINDYHKVYSFDLRRDRHRLLSDSASDYYRNVYFGTSKDWVFTVEDGTIIDGHVYYPVDFNPEKQYPVIVYYYGGTAPVTRSFSGRYPKELYAANGYIVYVMQPSGTTGFGQNFSQRHLNDWGIRVSGEIIESVTGFLEAHPYADSERVGAMGASYGGFMTMLLLTETDIFAAAVSHAGISNITSYWGEGFWGYLYSSVASANSFPWDTPEIFVDQSPIFSADKVNTPLLLTTGMSDTNVPPGETIQFYTALKLLGKDVEFIQVEGQDHHIVDYSKFKLWKNGILSWFDRWLKDESEWWENSFP